MMRVALLCPGPSLAAYPGRSGFDLVLGVNRAAIAHGCDVWVACDVPCVRQHMEAVQGMPLLLTGMESSGTLDTDHPRYRGPITDIRPLLTFCDPGWSWQSFSASCAFVYAVAQGATRIDLWGADWSGTADHDGAEAGQNRSPERWQWERNIFLNLLFPWAESRGITVVRHTL
jgi:hypothetical protein